MTAPTTTKIRLCLGSHLSVAGGVSKAIAAAIELDTDSLQIFTKNASRWKQKDLEPVEIERFAKLRKEWGEHKPIISHGSYLVNLASPDDVLWEKSIAGFCDELVRGAQLGLDGVVTHPGAHVGSGMDQGISRAAKGLRRVLDHCDEAGIQAPPVLLENTAGGGSTMGREFEEIARIIELVDAPGRLGVCLDSCHMFAAGYDIREQAGYEAMTAELDKLFGAGEDAIVGAWHLNDSKGECASRLDRHEHIGRGEIGQAAFGFLMNDERFFGIPKILETSKKDDMDRINLDLLMSL